MTIMHRKKIIILIILVLAVPVVLLAGALTLVQSPRAINTIAAFIQPLTGIFLHVDNISLNRHLEVSLSDFQIRTVGKDGFDISLARADVQAGLGSGLKVEVEKIRLTGPKFTFHIKDDDSETDPFPVLKKIPPVRLLEVKNGHLVLKSNSSVYSIPGMNMTIRDFEPEGGGNLNGESRFHISNKGLTAQGMLAMKLNVSRFSPRPVGSGSLRVVLKTGTHEDVNVDDMTLATGLKLNGHILSFVGANASIRSLSRGQGSEVMKLRKIKTLLNGSYDQKTSGFVITSLEMSGAGIGSVKGRASGTVKPLTWGLSLRASSLDLAEIFSLVKPLLPETYRDWTFKGKGDVAVESEGRHIDGTTLWQANAVVDLSAGGFASPDSSKAGERITGKIELKLGSPDKGRQCRFNATMSCGDGELLWDQYYQDFKGESVKLVSQGSFTQNPFFLSSSGTFDLFQTGNYAFSGNLSNNHAILGVDAKGISCRRLFTVLLQNYIKQNYPNLQDVTLEGESDLKLAMTISPQQKMIEGNFALRGGAVHSPSNSLVLTGLNISLPYDLVLGGNPELPPANITKKGSLFFDMFKKDNIRIAKMETSVILSGNQMIMPDPIDFSLFGGNIRLAGLRLEKLLFSEMRVDTAITIRQLHFKDLVGQASPVPLEGTLDGDLPSIVYQYGKWTTTGGLVAQIFGGRINVENLFAGRLFSSSRFFGADVTLDQIDLEAVTASIRLGRMTGLIKGSLNHFMMEYGQPSRFDLVIQTDRTRKVPKQISVDAINNLSIISTGSGAVSAILNSGFNRFFKDYPYSEIGFRCTLADDVFSLRGLILEGGTEYLVRKAWFRGIDIINQNPDNSISFKDMSERVGRIFQSRPESKDVS